LPVSPFDPVLFETSLGFVAAGLLQCAFAFRSAISEAAGRGILLGLAAPGPLARSAQIEEITHAKFGEPECTTAIQARFVRKNYADTVTPDHCNREPARHCFKVAVMKFGYTCRAAQDTVA